MADQRQNYSKGAHSGDAVTSRSLEMAKGGHSSGENSGPTGSSRSYAKKGSSASSPSFCNWNPMKCKASTYGIAGCGSGDC